MLKGQLIHPHILSALAKAGHGSKVLISDGNYPHWTRRGRNAEVVYLNLAPSVPTVTQVLRAIISVIPIEEISVMDYARTGAHAIKKDPPIWDEFRQVLRDLTLNKLSRFKFYEASETNDVCLTIATGDQRIYANLLLTIGVVK